MKPLAPLFLAALLFATADASAASPQVDASATGSMIVAQQDTPLPEGGSCAGDIARYRAIQEQDIKMGHVAKSVYNRIKAEIDAAEVECNNGHEAHARAMIVTSKKKHGYPTDL
jgi:hypothetical protein